MWLSIMGMYEFDPSIFDGLELPIYIDSDKHTHKLNKNDVINNILLNCAELELIYSDIDTMKLAISVWAQSNLNKWTKLFATQIIKYNPIWNVDADIIQNRKIARDRDGSNQNINAVSGYNSEGWSNNDKNNGTYSDNEDINDSFTERRTGNIGVTATQDLIKKEREIADFNIIDNITNSFKERFCILVY